MEAFSVQHQKEDELTENYMQMLPIKPSLSSSESSEGEALEQEAEPAGVPHEAIFLVLACLPVFELLAMSEVCTSLRDAVAEDVLAWLDVVVEEPLSARITDEILARVVSRANGRMRTLALINCSKITNDGLLRVIDKNPFIRKLHLPGCNGLTSDGIIRAVKTLASKGSNSLESLQIRSIYSIKKQNLEMLLDCVRTYPEKGKPEPVFYHHQYGTSSSRCNKADRPIDVEVCPKCGEVRMVFDCTRDTCKKQDQLLAACRGCKFCTARCEECGGCMDNEAEELEETVCSDFLCPNCWLNLPKCSICNRPYCRRHANSRGFTSRLPGFICEVCEVTATGNPDYDVA